MPDQPEVVDQPIASATQQTTSWVEVVTGETVVRSTALIGGMSSAMTKHELANGECVVSRHITNTEWLRREPHLIEAEATALTLLAGSAVRAPELIATDAAAGRLAMSFLDGTMVASPAGLTDRIPELARIALEISRVELPHGHNLPQWKSWASPILDPPAWGDTALWTEAITAYRRREQPTIDRPVLLHRDLHPLNLLWNDDRPNVVDWVNACTGHPHAELGHCRWNLAVLAGLDCADAFLDLYLTASDDGPYDSFWDLAPVMSFLPGPMGFDGWHAVGRTDLTTTVIIERTEAFLRAALVDKAIDTRNDRLDD